MTDRRRDAEISEPFTPERVWQTADTVSQLALNQADRMSDLMGYNSIGVWQPGTLVWTCKNERVTVTVNQTGAREARFERLVDVE